MRRAAILIARRLAAVAAVLPVLPLGAQRHGTRSAGATQARPACALDSVDWTDHDRTALPGGLREVSGLAVLPDGRLLAHDDERGLVSILDGRSGKRLAQFSLGPRMPRDDFEGIALLGDRLFLSTSGGRLYETRVGRDGEEVPYHVHDTGLGSLCEMEGLGADPETGTLLLPCKEPRTSELRGRTVVFAWSADRSGLEGIRFRAQESRLHIDKVNTFRPSAIELLPAGGLLLLSGADRAIAHVVPPGVVRCVRRLDSRHGQPEGLAMLPDGRLAIADEGSPARLTFYSRRSR